MKRCLRSFYEASEKGPELDMKFVGVQEQCDAGGWPEGGAEVLKLGHELSPRSEVRKKRPIGLA